MNLTAVYYTELVPAFKEKKRKEFNAALMSLQERAERLRVLCVEADEFEDPGPPLSQVRTECLACFTTYGAWADKLGGPVRSAEDFIAVAEAMEGVFEIDGTNLADAVDAQREVCEQKGFPPAFLYWWDYDEARREADGAILSMLLVEMTLSDDYEKGKSKAIADGLEQLASAAETISSVASKWSIVPNPGGEFAEMHRRLGIALDAVQGPAHGVAEAAQANDVPAALNAAVEVTAQLNTLFGDARAAQCEIAEKYELWVSP